MSSAPTKRPLYFIQSSLSSNLGLSFDLRLSDSTSLLKSFLRILETCCVSWINRFLGKPYPLTDLMCLYQLPFELD